LNDLIGWLINQERKKERKKLLYQIYFAVAATCPNCLNLRRQQKLVRELARRLRGKK